MTIVRPIQCFGCARLTRGGEQIAMTGLPVVATCEAYPDGIPQAMHEGADHRKPLGGEDGGLLFLPDDSQRGREALRRWQRTYGLLAE
jgi:hypothetical protein